MQDRILITGGAGFLGINLIRYLLNKGYSNIISFDISTFDYPEKIKIQTIRADIRDIEVVKKSMKGVDIVIHTAAALPLYKKEDILTTDIDGTQNLLDAAYENGVKRFVHISSTAVYGIPDHHPLMEDDKLDGVGPYGVAKIKAEELCVQFRAKGICIPILRPKSFIGPERLGVFALFYDWAKDGKGFPMIGNGKNRYQFLDVEDLCAAIHCCITNDSESVNDTFNIGAMDFTTMKEDYQAVLDYAGFNKKISTFPAAPVIIVLRILEFFKLSPLYKWVYETASKDSFVSIDKALRTLNWKPVYSNKDALIRNYRWYIDNLSKFKQTSGVSHRVPWKQGILSLFKFFF